MALQRIDALIQFVRADKPALDSFRYNIPKGYLVYAVDTKELKLGDGKHTFSQLPNLIDLDEVFSAVNSGIESSIIDIPSDADINKIVIINSEGHFTYGTITIDNLIDFINNNPSIEDSQNTLITTLGIIFNKILSNLQPSDEGSFVIINDTEDKFVVGENIEDYINSIIDIVIRSLLFEIKDIKMYSNNLLNEEITDMLYEGSEYYAKIVNEEYDDNINFQLTSNNPNVLIEESTSKDVYKISILSGAGNIPITTFTAEATLYGISKSFSKDFNITAYIVNIAYETSNHCSYINKIIYDSAKNVYVAIGEYRVSQYCEDPYSACLLTMDTNLNILAFKTYTDYNIRFKDIIIDDNGDYVICGYSILDGDSYHKGFIGKVTYDPLNTNDPFSNLTGLYVDSNYGGSYYDTFFRGLVFDSSIDSYIVVGDSTALSEGGYPNGLIVSFNKSLSSIIDKKAISENSNFNDIAIDNNGNYVIIGNTHSDRLHNFIIKTDKSFNMIGNMICNSSIGGEALFSIVVHPVTNDYYCVGYSHNGSFGIDDGIIIHFDENLNKIDAKNWGGGSYDHFNDIFINDNGNMIVTGHCKESYVDLVIIIEIANDLSTILKQKAFNINSIGNSCCKGYNGNYIIGGIVNDRLEIIFSINPLIPDGTYSSTNSTPFEFNDISESYGDFGYGWSDAGSSLSDVNFINTSIIDLTPTSNAISFSYDALI